MVGSIHALVPIAGMLMILGIVIGSPIARAYARRVENRPSPTPLPVADLTARLDRIEQGMEAMATEIERIAEGQRFTTKLLSEARPSAAIPAAVAPSAVPSDRPYGS